MFHWKNLIFDIKEPNQRNEYMYGTGEDSAPAKKLPITRESDPLYHAALCSLLLEGGISMLASEAINFEVLVATTIPLDVPVEYAPPDVDFATLADAREAMQLAYVEGKDDGRAESKAD